MLMLLLFLLWPRRCHCTRQPLVYGCSPHSPGLRLARGLLNFLKCRIQFSAVLSDHVDPSFLLFFPLSGSMYIAVVCYFGGIAHSSADSDVQSIVVACSVFCLLFQF